MPRPFDMTVVTLVLAAIGGLRGTASQLDPAGRVDRASSAGIVSLDMIDMTDTLGMAPSRRSAASGSAPLVIMERAFGWEVSSAEISSFALDAPETLSFHGLAKDDDYVGAEFGPGGDTSFVYAFGYFYNQLVTISTSTGDVTVVGTASPVGSHVWCGLAWDATSNTMFACSTDLFGSALYTINLGTGNAIPIGPISNSFGAIALAAHPLSGQLYTYDIVTDEMLLVSKSNGEGTVIGAIGFDANFAQGMDFDDATGELYLAAFNGSTFQGELRIADTSTGATTLIGALGSRFPGGLVEIAGLAIAPPSCRGDFDNDDVVGSLDLDALLDHWGPLPDGEQPWDANGDHQVGFFDLVNLLMSWGDCP